MRKSLKADNVDKVLRRFAKWVSKEPSWVREDVANRLNALLNELESEDAFGTEGQLDPRGDPR